jgi:hypothetical protein
MGKCETSTASLGIKILLSELIKQINEDNFNLIKKMLNDGIIEDSNDYFNEVYQKVIGYDDADVKLPENYLEFKKYLKEQFKTNGSYYKSKFSNEVEPYLNSGCLYDRYLLIPIKEILSTERWGYSRYGINSTSRLIDFDLKVNTDEYKMIKKFTIAFIIKQHSG